jgi:hypothetical protein
MAQDVSRWPLTAESRVRARANPRGICGGQNCPGTGLLRVLRFPLSISFSPWVSTLMYHLGWRGGGEQ